MIENGYLEADFDEVFGQQYEQIVKSGFENDPDKLVKLSQVIYFLSKAEKIKTEDDRLEALTKKIFEGLEWFLTIHFFDFKDINYIKIKTEVFHIYTTYLKLIYFSDYTHFSRSLLDDYASLYRKGFITSLLSTGYYLKRIAEKYALGGIEDVIDENIDNEIKDFYPPRFSLKKRIDFAKLMEKDNDDFMLNLQINQKEWKINDILNTVQEKTELLGYGSGLGRFLIYSIDKNIELL